MEAQELITSLKKQVKKNLSTKDFQKVCSILGNIKTAYEKEFITTHSFEAAKNSVSKMQSWYSKLLKILPKKELSKLKEFISSCQSEVNAFGHRNHQHFQNLLEKTGANIMEVPAYMFSGDSDDYDEYWINRQMAEGLHGLGI